MKVGQVTEIEILEGGKYFLVTFVIDHDEIEIPVDSKATIFMRSSASLNLNDSMRFIFPSFFYAPVLLRFKIF